MSSTKLLKAYAYYRTGGQVGQLYEPQTVEQLQDVMARLDKQGSPYFFLGGGSNSLVMDEPWEGAVVVFCKMDRIEFLADGKIVVGAGFDNSELAKAAHAKGLSGIAWMYGLPGQVGGTVRMNARCYGGEISQVVEQVVTVDRAGKRQVYRDPGVFRGYKDTIFMDNGEAVAEVTLRTERGESDKIWQTMNFCRTDRESKGQYDHPSCGCVFKNDYNVGVPSGMLLEKAGVKGFQHEGTQINPHHANFVYNVAGTSRSILGMTIKMREAVYTEFGVWMEYEMEMLGNLPKDLAVKVSEQRPQNIDQSKLTELKKAFKKKGQ